ncbi:lysM domain receptor-like kinase 3 isoform X1 [Trifolium pratense]|uniref:lysM domain receptor-like kinase 3 isoform X1 n=1 Tax=Trifolium pratense TaxID=57577 RepID=UPI001E6907B8|nr:lysM domain receptor-like kinase 3 isoform X1 [Trifolium pratense]
MELRFIFSLSFLLLSSTSFITESKCNKGCNLALASYTLTNDVNLTYISNIMKSNVLRKPQDIIITNNKSKSKRVNVPFPCDCINGEFLAHTFVYQFQPGETYTSVAEDDFSNLTTDVWLQNFNIYRPTNIPDFGMINVSVNCSCGNRKVSKDYGLFITYPLRSEDTLESIAKDTEIAADLLQRYNPGVNFSQGSGLVFIPGKDQNGSYMPLHSSTIGIVAIVGISVGVLAGLLLLSICVYIKYYLKEKAWKKKNLILDDPNMNSDQTGTHITGIIVENSLEFSYEELSVATNNFSEDNKIGEGGFGEVFYAELRGQIAAVKKMKMKASKEFYAELKVLTRVHHLNLVRLIGYCVEGFLFLVYEYIDNGNLSQNLRDLEREPLPWSTRMQIALDSARGLEYIHEHTVRVYIHRDIKSENILLDKNFRAKVADFGLSKLADVENSTSSAIVAEGTFGYMPPENAYGHISRKIDVYAFGVVLYELISAKAAVIKIDKNEFKSLEIRTNESVDEYKSLVALFDEVIDDEEGLRKLVDPRLGDNYSIDSIKKMTQLAKTCTNRDPKQRPRMRAVMVSLMKLNSSIDDRSMIVSEALSPTMEHDD